MISRLTLPPPLESATYRKPRGPTVEDESKEIAACERILTEAGLKTRLHAYGTNVEGDWDAVFAAVKRCHETLHEMGVPRISTSMRFGTRTDRDQSMEDKIHSVEQKLGR